MQFAVVAAMCVAAALAAPATPVISEDFYADVQVEVHDTNGTHFGFGKWAVDQTQNKIVHNFEIEQQHSHEKIYVFHLERYDQATSYEINSADRNTCAKTPLTGNAPSTWSWLSQAKYQGQNNYHGVIINIWGATIGGVQFLLGVDAKNESYPIIYNTKSTSSDFRIAFQRFYPTTQFDSHAFDIPSECAKASTTAPEFYPVKMGANPPLPSISEDFYSDTQVEIHDSKGVHFGEGRWAIDHTDNKEVEGYEVDDHRGPTIKVLDLQRYDLGEAYSVNSRDLHDCQKQAINGSAPSLWGWLSLAVYGGQYNYHGVEIDLWNATIGGVHYLLGVASQDLTIPVIFNRYFPTGEIRVAFWHFTAGRDPTSHDYDIPPQCSQQALVAVGSGPVQATYVGGVTTQ